MKQHVDISILSLILFVSLVLLNNYSIQRGMSSSEKQSLGIGKFTIENWSMVDLMDQNPWGAGNQPGKTLLFEETPAQNDRDLTALFLDKFLSDPIHHDLPPPANLH